jgi:ribonuclease BN (tRNA processing enzyme)
MTDHLIRAATDWPWVFRKRIAELGLSHLDVDHLAGLPGGYCNKILNGKKKPGAVTIEKLCRTLKLVLRPEIDPTENCALECVAGMTPLADDARERTNRCNDECEN